MSQQLTTRLIHVGAPPFKQRVAPVNVPVVRLHIGLEDAGDLIADLEQAFRLVYS